MPESGKNSCSESSYYHVTRDWDAENTPQGYITGSEHEVVEKFADTVAEAIRRQP